MIVQIFPYYFPVLLAWPLDQPAILDDLNQARGPYQLSWTLTFRVSTSQLGPSTWSLNLVPQLGPSTWSLNLVPQLGPSTGPSTWSLNLVPQLGPSPLSLAFVPRLCPSPLSLNFVPQLGTSNLHSEQIIIEMNSSTWRQIYQIFLILLHSNKTKHRDIPTLFLSHFLISFDNRHTRFYFEKPFRAVGWYFYHYFFFCQIRGYKNPKTFQTFGCQICPFSVPLWALRLRDFEI